MSQIERKGRMRGRLVEASARQEVLALLADRPRRRDLLIEFLHLIQDAHGHLGAAHLAALAEEMKLAPTEVFEVATFYHHFDVVKEGQKAPPALTVRVCDSITCEMFGANMLHDHLNAALGSGVRVQRVPCVGRCHAAPVAVVAMAVLGVGKADALAFSVLLQLVILIPVIVGTPVVAWWLTTRYHARGAKIPEPVAD